MEWVACEPQIQFLGRLGSFKPCPTLRLEPGAQQPHLGAGVQHRGRPVSGRRLPPRLGTVALSGAGGGDHELQLSRRGDKLALVTEEA